MSLSPEAGAGLLFGTCTEKVLVYKRQLTSLELYVEITL